MCSLWRLGEWVTNLALKDYLRVPLPTAKVGRRNGEQGAVNILKWNQSIVQTELFGGLRKLTSKN